MSVRLVGTGKERIFWVNSDVGFIPVSVTRKPRKLTSHSPNWNFLGLNVHPPLDPISKYLQTR